MLMPEPDSSGCARHLTGAQPSAAAQLRTVAFEMLQSLVELQQKAELQSNALHNLKSRALASASPSKSLLEEIETHHIDMERTLAVLIAFGCKGSSMAMRAKEELKFKLGSD